jgi:hypothetical protein
MSPEQRIIGALRAPNAGPALRVLVGELAGEGHTKADIAELLEGFLVQHRARAEYREADEEAVLEVLDALRGWCHPGAELVAKEPTE